MYSMDHFAGVATDQGIVLSEIRLRQAQQGQGKFRVELLRLRALPMPYLTFEHEPLEALAWIRDGGRS